MHLQACVPQSGIQNLPPSWDEDGTRDLYAHWESVRNISKETDNFKCVLFL